jgi:hypothetical protein
MLSVPDKTLALSHIRTETSAGYLYNTSANGTTKTSQRQGRTPKTQKGLQMAESLGEVFPGARPQSSIADRRNIQLARVSTQIPRVLGRLVTFRPRVSWFSCSECWLMVVLVLRLCCALHQPRSRLAARAITSSSLRLVLSDTSSFRFRRCPGLHHRVAVEAWSKRECPTLAYWAAFHTF